jgi:hypothetical protein
LSAIQNRPEVVEKVRSFSEERCKVSISLPCFKITAPKSSSSSFTFVFPTKRSPLISSPVIFVD